MVNAVGTVRQNSYEAQPDQTQRTARINRRGELVVVDFWSQLVIDGRMFHMQIGNESAPVDSTTTVDDELVWMLVDNAANTSMLPALVNLQLQTSASDTAPIESYFEIDRAKARYSTGGSAFVPENLCTSRPRASVAAAAYVGTDITALAKTAVPGSMEISRKAYAETTPSNSNEPVDFAMNLTPMFSARIQPGAMVVGVGSMLVHLGGANTNCTGYGIMQWAELPTASID